MWRLAKHESPPVVRRVSGGFISGGDGGRSIPVAIACGDEDEEYGDDRSHAGVEVESGGGDTVRAMTATQLGDGGDEQVAEGNRQIPETHDRALHRRGSLGVGKFE